MSLTMLGLSHNTGAPVEIREQLAFTTPGMLPRALAYLKSVLDGMAECVLLSTCNRTELYVASPTDLSTETLQNLLLSARELMYPEKVVPYLVERRGHKAVEHLFRVTAGLDSMILGENDVVRQVREAYSAAAEIKVSGKTLNALFHEALRVGKRSRTENDLGRGAFSIGHAAAEVAKNIFGAGEGRTVLLLGAGKMSETTARHLTQAGATSILVANRTYDRAVRLAETLNGRAIHYDEFPHYLTKTDIVIASTAAPHAVVHQEMVEEALKHRRHRDPLFFIDIAVPRDIAPDVGELPGVFVYNIDDLQRLVEEDMAARRKRATQAEQMVREEALAFVAKLRATQTADPLVTSLRAKQHAVIAGEAARLRQKLPHLSDTDWQAIQAAFQSVENKLLHEPTLKIKEYAAATDAEAETKILAVRELFGLAEDIGKRD